jgi:hypothetical protein
VLYCPRRYGMRGVGSGRAGLKRGWTELWFEHGALDRLHLANINVVLRIVVAGRPRRFGDHGSVGPAMWLSSSHVGLETMGMSITPWSVHSLSALLALRVRVR